MKYLFAGLLALSALFHWTAPAAAQPCQWNYSMVPGTPDANQGTATATYCGNVTVAGTITGQALNMVDSIAAMQAIILPASVKGVIVAGTQGAGDTFYWQTGVLCNAVTGGGDGGTTFCANDGAGGYLTTGYWQRQYLGGLHATWFNGGDIGAKINAAYAALPDYGGEIVVDAPPSGETVWNFSTPIVFATNGKCVSLTGSGPSQAASAGVTLNYTPTTATTALTLDCVNQDNGNGRSSAGIRNLNLLNNNCETTGGCGSSAVGIEVTSVNWGDREAQYMRLSVQGFGVAYKNHNQYAVDGRFIDFTAYSNTLVFELGTASGQIGQQIQLRGGTIAANNKVLYVPTAYQMGPEMDISGGTLIFDNQLSDPSSAIFDCTELMSSGTACNLQMRGVHLETWPSATQAHYIAGCFTLSMTGGIMESAPSTGTFDWMIHPTCNNVFFSINQTIIATPGTITQVVLADALVKGVINVLNASGDNFVNLVGGTNKAYSLDMSTYAFGTTHTTNIPNPTTFQDAFSMGGLPLSGTAAGSLCVASGGVLFVKTTAGSCL